MNGENNVSPSTDTQLSEAAGETHDNLPFGKLAAEYNFLNISSYARVFSNLILHEIKGRSKQLRVLDVGCGRGIGRQVSLQHEVRQYCDEYWGLEPDPGVEPEDGLFDNYQHALMETADIPEQHFDVIYSSMVMEHVEDPDAFLRAVQRCLKPGGVYLFVTPNANSFVPWATKMSRYLRLDELILRLVRQPQAIDEYHYPVQFRFNTPQQIARYARPLGFLEAEFAYIEGSGSRGYFPGPFRLFYMLLILKRKLIRKRRSLVTMICRLTKRK